MPDRQNISGNVPHAAAARGEVLLDARSTSTMVQPAGWPVPTYQSLFARFSDPESYVAAGAAGQARFVAAPGRSFRAELFSVVLDRISVTSAHATAPASLTATVPLMHAFVFATGAAPPRRLSGHEVRPDQIFAFRPNGDATSAPDTADPWPYALVAMPFETLAMAAAQLRVKRPVALNDDTLIDTGGRAMARLRGLVADAAHIAQEKLWLAAMPEPARALSGTILEALLDCFRDGQAIADRPARHRRRTVIGRLIETARFAPERLLSLPDICAICGVPPRTLNLVCQEFLGVSAMRYARLRRLDHARERLLCGGTDAEGVTGVATALGFWELGRFASAYRARFGETPSETLRRGEVR